MSTAFHYFRWAFLVTAVGLGLAFWLGWGYDHRLAGAVSFLLIGAVLAVLEISLSFDNAIVNANKLKEMTPVWQHRFLTWGILIAVFGMRIVFPLLIVVVAAGIGPIAALRLAAFRPEEYAEIIAEAHLPIAAFGGEQDHFVPIAAVRGWARHTTAEVTFEARPGGHHLTGEEEARLTALLHQRLAPR